MHSISSVALAVVCFGGYGVAQSLQGNMVFKKGDSVPLYANKVGPFANPSEQYEFYTLPFCAPKEEERKGLHLGEVLGGDRMMKSLYSLPFLVKFTARTLCSYTLQPKEIEMFQRAIDADYFFELIYDGIPVRGFIGEKKKEIIHGESVTAYHLFTHYIFSISHNGEKILGVRWEHDPFDFLDITEKDKELDVHFKYSSRWSKATADNNHLLGTPGDQEHLQIRWFSILNSIGTVLLLTGFLAVILMRVLRNDISRYALMEQGGDSAMTEETGWKLVHGDVFRTPSNPELLCAVLGNGMQLLCLVIGVLFLALIGVYSHYNRGALLVASLVRRDFNVSPRVCRSISSYLHLHIQVLANSFSLALLSAIALSQMLLSLTSVINGYVAATAYAKLDGVHFPMALALSYGLFLGPLFVVGAALNMVAVAYGSSTALPFGTVLVILLLLTLVSLPLNLLGAATGRALARPLSVPCRTARLPRAIPPLPWHRRGPVLVAAAGFLPFRYVCVLLRALRKGREWGRRLSAISRFPSILLFAHPL
jgi:hypothetical protein